MRQGHHPLRRWPLAAAASLAVLAAGLAGVRLMPASAETGVTAGPSGTAGCGKAAAIANGTHTVQINGKSRSFILKLPDKYTNTQPYRLVFAFHWLGGNATDVANGQTVQPYYGLRALANDSTIFVAPQGLSESMGTGWANTGGQDVAFVDEMVKQLQAGLCVDPSQLYSLGFSYGGGMSYALACARPTVFRAVAIYSGGLISQCSGGAQPIAYMQVHGLGDTVLPIANARTMRDRFAKNNGCTAANPPEPGSGSRTHTRFAYSGCASGYPVTWYAFDGGHTPVPTDNGNGIWLPAETWKFFTQFASTSPGTPTSTGRPTTAPPSTGRPTTAPPSSVRPTTVPPSTVTPSATSTSPGLPSPTRPTTSPTKPSKPPATGVSCRVNTNTSAWASGLVTNIVVVNTGRAPIMGWSLAFTLPEGQRFLSGWGAYYTAGGGQMTARNLFFNGYIPPGGWAYMALQAAHSGDTTGPTAFALNGTACTTA